MRCSRTLRASDQGGKESGGGSSAPHPPVPSPSTPNTRVQISRQRDIHPIDPTMFPVDANVSALRDNGQLSSPGRVRAHPVFAASPYRAKSSSIPRRRASSNGSAPSAYPPHRRLVSTPSTYERSVLSYPISCASALPCWLSAAAATDVAPLNVRAMLCPSPPGFPLTR